MRPQIDFRPAAQKDLRRLPLHDRRRLLTAIARLPDGDVRRLAGSGGMYRLRVGERRVLFRRGANGEVIVERVASRGSAYRHPGR